MRFVLVRHAQSTNNVLWERTGSDVGRSPDPGLTDLGRRQADALAEAAGRWRRRPTHLYSSLMTRAVQTAGPLADALDLPLVGHAALHEVGGPFVETGGVRTSVPGASRTALQRITSRLVLDETVGEGGWYAEPYEPLAASAHRAERVLRDVRGRHGADDVIVLVTHGWFTQYLLRALLGETGVPTWFVTGNTAVSVLADADPALECRLEVHSLNDLSHLRPADVTL